jgi:hypothetical protein
MILLGLSPTGELTGDVVYAKVLAEDRLVDAGPMAE